MKNKKLLAKMAASIYSGILFLEDKDQFPLTEIAHASVDMAEEILNEIDRRYPVDEALDADLKRVFGEPSEKTPPVPQEDFNRVADIRRLLLCHPDSDMVRQSRLHFLGDEAQEWWRNFSEKQ